MTARRRAGAGLVAALVLSLGGLAGCGGGDDEATTTTAAPLPAMTMPTVTAPLTAPTATPDSREAAEARAEAARRAKAAKARAQRAARAKAARAKAARAKAARAQAAARAKARARANAESAATRARRSFYAALDRDAVALDALIGQAQYGAPGAEQKIMALRMRVLDRSAQYSIKTGFVSQAVNQLSGAASDAAVAIADGDAAGLASARSAIPGVRAALDQEATQ